MPANDWINVETQTEAAPAPPPDTPRVFAMLSSLVPLGFTQKVRQYSSIGELDDDGWTGAEPAYQAIADLFAQQPTVTAVTNVVMIRREPAVAEEWTIDILVNPGTGDFKLFDDGVEIATFTAAADADTVIRDGLIASLDALVYTGATVDADTYTVTRVAPGVPMLLSQQSPSGDSEMDVGVGPTVAAVGLYGDLEEAFPLSPFWGVMGPGQSDEDNDEGRRWVQADRTRRRNFFFAESDDEGIQDSGDLDNLATRWFAAQFDRVSLMSHPVAADYIQASGVGRLGGSFPGARAWHYFDISGHTTSDGISPRTPDQTATMKARRVSYTERLDGPLSPLKILHGAVPKTGEFVYHRWAEDWWWYTINATIDGVMKRPAGVNLDDGGLEDIIAAIDQAMEPLLTNDVVAPGYSITFTPLDQVPAGELAIGDFATTGEILVEAVITPKLRRLSVRAIFALAPT